LTDPKYIKDKEKTFQENGNGWWWNDGKGWEIGRLTKQELYKIKYREIRKNDSKSKNH
jgi:hypothetical protein